MRYPRCLLPALLITCFAAAPRAAAQQTPSAETGREEKSEAEKTETIPQEMERLPIQWLIGPYIPVQRRLHPLDFHQRERIYLRQTFLTFGSYAARAFAAGVDQARGSPDRWGGGMTGYGRRYASRYGQFVIQNSLVTAGDAAFGFEPRYDFCRCRGFWPRARHAVSRNFVAYDRSETELHPQFPLYAAALAAGMLHNEWLPGHPNLWRGGAFSVLSQAGIGAGYDFLSEFSLDILHKFGISRNFNGRLIP